METESNIKSAKSRTAAASGALTVIIEAMRHIMLILLILFTNGGVIGQQPCGQKLFERLSSISKKVEISDKEFIESTGIVNKLDSIHCNDYIVIINGEQYGESTLTFLFGTICLKCNSTKAVIGFIKYRKLHTGSAEEELSFSLERLFIKRPDDVLKYGGSLLDDLAWGFVNNHYYGVKDPFENDPNKAFTKYENPPKRVLYQNNYKEMFFLVNPTLKSNYTKYQKQIDYLLNEIFKLLKETNQ
jgi:hypothetical protein